MNIPRNSEFYHPNHGRYTIGEGPFVCPSKSDERSQLEDLKTEIG